MKIKYDISILLPSKGRPFRLNKFLNSLKDTIYDYSKVEIIVCLDIDEKEMYNKIDIENIHYTFFYGPKNRTMGQLNRDCLYYASGKTIFYSNDDVIFKTKNWDMKLKEKIKTLKDNIFLMYPNDLLKKSKLCTFPIMDRKLLLENIDFLPEEYSGSFMDTHIMDIFKEYRKGEAIYYLNNIICKHEHFRKDYNLYDKTYARRERFSDDRRFIKLSYDRKLLACKLENRQMANNKNLVNTIFYLLIGNSKLIWRIKIFLYMIVRLFYKYLIIDKMKKSISITR